MEAHPTPLRSWLAAHPEWSQRRLANEVNRTEAWISRVCRGQEPASERLKAEIAAATGTSVEDLFGDEVVSQARDLVERTTSAQGLALIIGDPAVLARVATVLAAAEVRHDAIPA